MKKLLGVIAIAVLLLTLAGCHTLPKTYVVDCTQAKKITKISDTFLSAIGDPSRSQAETIANRYITKAVCLKDLKGDVSFSPQPYFFDLSHLSNQYQIVSYQSAGFRSPGSLQVKFDNGTILNFCFSLMVINCNLAQTCECPYDFNSQPKAR